MAVENGTWIMHGLAWDNPLRVRSWQELISWVNEIGFLPLFKNEVPGFSAEEHVSDRYWWTGDVEQDPWEWRQLIARSGEVAYGKFFGKKVGFISREWFPHFANFRRGGYDFDSRWDEGLASRRQKRIMDLFQEREKYSSHELKRLAGFGRGGERNFEGTVTELQMQGYLLIRDFIQRVNRQGVPYGWYISVYTAPESLWGREYVTSAYSADPADSREQIYEKVCRHFPDADAQNLLPVLG